MSVNKFIQPYTNLISYRSLKNFNEILQQVIVEKSIGKKRIAVHLSGGKDTRAILSIVLKKKIPISSVICIDPKNEHNIDDLFISRKIASAYALDITMIDDCTEFYSMCQKGNLGFDLIFSGFLMTELLDRGFALSDIKILPEMQKTHIVLQELKEMCLPVLDERCLVASSLIPFYLKRKGIVNKYVIKKNTPDLLKYPIHSLPGDMKKLK